MSRKAPVSRRGEPRSCRADASLPPPLQGDALLFFDMDIEGSKGDRKALHASCPTTKGMKWTATKWIHNKPYMGASAPASSTTGTIAAPQSNGCSFVHVFRTLPMAENSS